VALLPTLRESRTRDDLNAMLISHERNIELVAARLADASAPGREAGS
jgi:hypothetical protein